MWPRRTYVPFTQLEVNEIRFTLNDRGGKTVITMTMGAANAEVAMRSPSAVTMYPRVNGDGNFGTLYGPTDQSQTQYLLDLSSNDINGHNNMEYHTFRQTIDNIDDKLLDFVYQNQQRILGRRNLSKDEIKMLQIRSVRTKYDTGGEVIGTSMQLKARKYVADGMGGKTTNVIAVADHCGQVVPNGQVRPGDVVAATMYANCIYTGVGGDKFGIQWAFEDVCVICQRQKLDVKTEVAAFKGLRHHCSAAYVDYSNEPMAVDVA